MEHRTWNAGITILETVMNFLVVFCLETVVFMGLDRMALAMEATGITAPGLVRQCLLVLAPLAYWQIRERAERFLPFILLHVLVVAGAVFLLGTDPAQRAVFGIFAAGYGILSVRTRLTEEDGRASAEGQPALAVGAVVSAAAFFLCAYLEYESGCLRILRAALIYTFLFFLDTYLRHLERFVQFNRASNSHIPVKRILTRGGGPTLVCSLFVVGLLAAGTDTVLMDRLSAIVKSVSFWLLRQLARFLGMILSLFSGEESGPVAEEAAAASQEMGLAEAAEQPAWLEALLQVIQFLLIAAVAVLVCYLLYKLVVAAVHRFYERSGRKREKTGIEEEIREKLEKEGRKKRSHSEKPVPFFAGTPEERIRRSFRRAVRKTERFRNPEGSLEKGRSRDLWKASAQEALVFGKTARELLLDLMRPAEGRGLLAGQAVLTEDPEKQLASQELVELYEKARYQQGCTREEAKRAERCAEILSKKKR